MDYANVVDEAIKQFYAGGNNETHNWLLQVQASPEAWSFAWQLLHPSKSWEVQFFAATTLHAKISKQWEEVPKSEYPILQARLLNSIKQENTPKFVLIKLCQSLAAFMAYSYIEPENRNKEKNLVEEVMEVLPYDSASKLELLLKVLSYIPGEFEAKQNIRKNAKIREGLINSWQKTVWLLQQVFASFNPMAQDNNTLYLLGADCTLSWLKTGLLPLEITGQLYPYLLAAAAHYAPLREDSHEDNTESWETVQDCIIMIVTHPDLYKRPQTLWEWATSLVKMALDNKEKSFCEILTSMGEAYSRSFLLALAGEGNDTQKWTSEGLIELLLECAEQKGRYPTDEIRSCIPFGFWFTLQDDLGTIDPPLENKAIDALKPIYARLANALLRKSTLPSSPSESGDADEQELFRCYRQDAADTLDYCYRVLGEDLLIILGRRLSEPLDNPEKWVDVESTLHAFEALADRVGLNECHYIPALMDLVVYHIPYNLYPPEVLACSCSTMGAYAEWIGENPDPWLGRVLQLVTMGLWKGPVTTPRASMALKDITRECGSYLAPFAPSILNTIGQILPNVTSEGGEGQRLMYAAGKLLNTLATVEEQLTYLNATLGLCIVKIKDLLKQPIVTVRLAVTNQLKMATMLFATLESPIGKTVLDGLLPIFNEIITHPEWSQDNVTLEAMYQCMQKSLSCLPNPEIDARPLLTILLTSYKNWPHPAALNLLSQLVILFGKDRNSVIWPVFAEISSLTLRGIKTCQSVRGDLSEWSDLMEAYLSLLAQICKKNGEMLLQVTDQIPDMLRCGMTCLVLPETATPKAAGSFLVHAIMETPRLQNFIRPIGQELVFIILQCVGGEGVRNYSDSHADVLWALNRMWSSNISEWLRASLESQNGPVVSNCDKEIFIRAVLRERSSKRRFYILLKDFSLKCRQKTVGL
ncbi:PREDICTED: importin-13 [Polistes dominula]|uniref:Importin-13 n=1 Tax=Polistes dominula TaxID=743375 RepID=A0ABM1J978_POLDO|nr:PREDICTED: importin-13 [Polistes dominula]XP_015189016.1 PREDICTED: importin-13 [Polistes dominula]